MCLNCEATSLLSLCDCHKFVTIGSTFGRLLGLGPLQRTISGLDGCAAQLSDVDARIDAHALARRREADRPAPGGKLIRVGPRRKDAGDGRVNNSIELVGEFVGHGGRLLPVKAPDQGEGLTGCLQPTQPGDLADEQS